MNFSSYCLQKVLSVSKKEKWYFTYRYLPSNCLLILDVLYHLTCLLSIGNCVIPGSQDQIDQVLGKDHLLFNTSVPK